MLQAGVKTAKERNHLFGEALAYRGWAQVLNSHNSLDPDIDLHMARSRDLFKLGSCLVEADRTEDMWDRMRAKRGNSAAS